MYQAYNTMKNKTLILKWFLILPFIFMTINSCKKKEDPAPAIQTAEKNIVLVNDNVEPGEFVIAQANFELAMDSATNIMVGGQMVKTAGMPTNQIIFIMPELPSGKVIVDYTNAGISKTIEVTIKTYTPITQPDIILTDYTTEINKTIANLQSHVEDGIIQLNPDYIDLANYLIQTINANFNSLTPSEKKEIAYFLRMNKPNPADFVRDKLTPGFYRRSDDTQYDPGESLVKVGLKFGRNVAIGAPSLALGFSLALLPSPLLIDKVAAVVLITTGLVFTMNAISDAKRVANLTGVADNITDFVFRSSAVELTKNTPLDLRLLGNYRNLSLSDKQSSNTNIVGIFSAFSTLQNGYNKLITIANKVKSWFPWKNPTVPNYTNLIANQSSIQQFSMPGNKITISGVSNPGINLSYTKYPDYLSLRATSKTISVQTAFTFNVTYDDPNLGIALKKVIQAVYIPVLDSSVIKDLLFRDGWQVVSGISEYYLGTNYKYQSIGPDTYDKYYHCNNMFYTASTYFNDGSGGFSSSYKIGWLKFTWTATSGAQYDYCSQLKTQDLPSSQIHLGQFKDNDFYDALKRNDLKVIKITETDAIIEITRSPWLNEDIVEKITLNLKY